MYRRWKESKGKDKEYENIIRSDIKIAFLTLVLTDDMLDCRKQVTASRLEAEKDQVVVPTTLEEYCIKHRNKPTEMEADMTDFYDDDYGDDIEDEDEDEDFNEDNEDSGNGESW